MQAGRTREGVFVAGPAPAAAQGGAQPGGGTDAAGAGGSRGTAGGGQQALTAKFLAVETGLRDGESVEVVAGLSDGASVITTGATALKDGDRVVPASTGRGARGGERAATESGGQPGSGR